MEKIIMLSYLVLGLLVIIFNMLELWYAAGVCLGLIVLGSLVTVGINIYKTIKKYLK